MIGNYSNFLNMYRSQYFECSLFATSAEGEEVWSLMVYSKSTEEHSGRMQSHGFPKSRGFWPIPRKGVWQTLPLTQAETEPPLGTSGLTSPSLLKPLTLWESRCLWLYDEDHRIPITQACSRIRKDQSCKHSVRLSLLLRGDVEKADIHSLGHHPLPTGSSWAPRGRASPCFYAMKLRKF